MKTQNKPMNELKKQPQFQRLQRQREKDDTQTVYTVQATDRVRTNEQNDEGKKAMKQPAKP